MDTSRAGGGASSKQQAMTRETPEQMLDVFKAAALSVTRLYKMSALAESRARMDGYQDCLADLHSFLDRENLGLCDGEGWKIRRWATERLDGHHHDTAAALAATTESEDETEKAAERTASPPDDLAPSTTTTTATAEHVHHHHHQQQNKAADSPASRSEEQQMHYVVPSQESFNFQTSHQYPNIATLDLSDSRAHDPLAFSSRSAKARLNGPPAGRTRTQGPLGRGAGSKRRFNFDDFFGGCFGGKDPLNPGGKRGRHA